MEARELRAGRRGSSSRNDSDVWDINRCAAEALKNIQNDVDRQEKRYRHAETILAMNPELRPSASKEPARGGLKLVHSASIDVSGVSCDPNDSI